MRKRHTSKGFLSTIQRKSGAVLVYRWYDPGTDGRPTERKRVLGLAKDFRSEAAARREVQRLGLGRRSGDGPSTFKELVDHWLQKECSMETDPKSRRAFSTKDNYRSYLRRWIIPRWGEVALEEVKAIAVEDWLSPLKKPNGKALAPGTKKKIRDLMHVLYAHAIRYEWIDHNPISAVRQGGQRLSTPSRLSVDQLSQLIFEVLKPRERVMVLIDFGTGLRRGELSGVKWEDIDFGDKKLTPRRSIVKQHVGPVKTEKSKNDIPLDEDLLDADETIQNVNGTISGLREPIRTDLTELQTTLQQAKNLLADIQGVVRTNDFKIDDTVENLRVATDNLGQLTDQLKQRPWSLIRTKQPRDRKLPD